MPDGAPVEVWFQDEMRMGQKGTVRRVISPPNLNRSNFSSPTEAKYAKISTRDEVNRERELQREYQKIWLPPPVKHNPWD